MEPMHVYDQDRVKFGLPETDQLDFSFISRQRNESIALINDLKFLAKKYNLYEHKPDPNIMTEYEKFQP